MIDDCQQGLGSGPEYAGILRVAGQLYGLASTPRSGAQLRLVMERRRTVLGLTPVEYELLISGEHEWAEIFNLLADDYEDSFFRYPAQFEVMVQLIREWSILASQRELTILSVGCGSGHEPYSLAMALAESGLMEKGWRVDIHGFDLSGAAVERARSANFSDDDLAFLYPAQIRKWFEPRVGIWHFKTHLAPSVSLFSANIYDFKSIPLAELVGRCDLVFCRGLSREAPDDMIRILERQVSQLLAPAALVFTAPGELWPANPEMILEERAAVTYYRCGLPRIKVNTPHKSRKNPTGSKRLAPEPVYLTDERWQALLHEAQAISSEQPEEARDLVLEALVSAQDEGVLNKELWEMLVRIEELLGRTESAQALSAALALWTDL